MLKCKACDIGMADITKDLCLKCEFAAMSAIPSNLRKGKIFECFPKEISTYLNTQERTLITIQPCAMGGAHSANTLLDEKDSLCGVNTGVGECIATDVILLNGCSSVGLPHQVPL